MAKIVDTSKNVSFGAVIPGAYAEKLTDYQWNNRMTRPELVRVALDEFADKRGIERPTDAVEAPAE